MPSRPMYLCSSLSESIRPKHRPISAASSCASRWVYMPTMTSRSVRACGVPPVCRSAWEPSGGALAKLIEMRVEHGHVDLLLLHVLMSHTLQGKQRVRLRDPADRTGVSLPAR